MCEQHKGLASTSPRPAQSISSAWCSLVVRLRVQVLILATRLSRWVATDAAACVRVCATTWLWLSLVCVSQSLHKPSGFCLLAGCCVVQINGTSVVGMEHSGVVKLIKGAGDAVEIVVIPHSGADQSQPLSDSTIKEITSAQERAKEVIQADAERYRKVARPGKTNTLCLVAQRARQRQRQRQKGRARNNKHALFVGACGFAFACAFACACACV